MAARVEPSNFYWYNSPVENIQAVLPRNQKITTQFPKNVALIRMAVTGIFAALLVAKIGLTVWAWPVMALASGFAIYTAVKHILMRDPLVSAMYTIAGGERQYHNLPEWQVDPDKKLYETISAINWDDVHHPLHRATTTDGRKVLIVKAYDYKERTEHCPSSSSKHVIAFVEKLGAFDVPRVISNLHEIIDSILTAFPLSWPRDLENHSSRVLGSGFVSDLDHTNRHHETMESSISSELVNELIQQREGRSVRLPRVELIE